MIGFFGKIVFETSDKRILTFNGFKRNVASRYAEHEVIGNKPKTEYLGPGLDTITFTIILNGNYGIKPREHMNAWTEMARSGVADYLIIGGSAIGVEMWAVESVSQAWDTIFRDGELFSGKIDVSLKEYISNM